MKLNTDPALEGALKALIKIYSDPDLVKEMREERARVLEYKRKNYEQKLAYWKNKSGYVVHETDSGFRAYASNSPEGKKLVADRNQAKRETDRIEFISESPLEAALDDLADKSQVSKIEIRAALSKYTGFTPEKFAALIEMVDAEGIDVV